LAQIQAIVAQLGAAAFTKGALDGGRTMGPPVQGEMTMTTRSCISCGSRRGMERFENKTFVVAHAGMRAPVKGLSGWRCRACNEIEFDPQSATRYAQAGDELVLRARRYQQQEIRRIRQKLRLSQKEAALLTGGGHNAFSRYERGEASPLPAVTNLFKLLDQHPELLDELRKGIRDRAVHGRPHRERAIPVRKVASHP
jgi:HTH-type transcriptional regulator/antitoxin MqsA